MSPLLVSAGRSGWRTVGRSGPATAAAESTCAASRASSTQHGGDVLCSGSQAWPLTARTVLGLREDQVERREVGAGQPTVQDGTAGHLALDLAEHADAAEPHAVDQQV